MTKSDLVDRLSETEKLPKARAELIVSTIFDALELALKRGQRVEIRGFGSFEIRHYRPYDGRNPRTGSTVSVKAKRLPFFKVGKELKDRVNAAAEQARQRAELKAFVASTSAPPAPSPVAASAPGAAQASAAAAQGSPGRAAAPSSEAGRHLRF